MHEKIDIPLREALAPQLHHTLLPGVHLVGLYDPNSKGNHVISVRTSTPGDLPLLARQGEKWATELSARHIPTSYLGAAVKQSFAGNKVDHTITMNIDNGNVHNVAQSIHRYPTSNLDVHARRPHHFSQILHHLLPTSSPAQTHHVTFDSFPNRDPFVEEMSLHRSLGEHEHEDSALIHLKRGLERLGVRVSHASVSDANRYGVHQFTFHVNGGDIRAAHRKMMEEKDQFSGGPYPEVDTVPTTTLAAAPPTKQGFIHRIRSRFSLGESLITEETKEDSDQFKLRSILVGHDHPVGEILGEGSKHRVTIHGVGLHDHSPLDPANNSFLEKYYKPIKKTLDEYGISHEVVGAQFTHNPKAGDKINAKLILSVNPEHLDRGHRRFNRTARSVSEDQPIYSVRAKHLAKIIDHLMPRPDNMVEGPPPRYTSGDADQGIPGTYTVFDKIPHDQGKHHEHFLTPEQRHTDVTEYLKKWVGAKDFHSSHEVITDTDGTHTLVAHHISFPDHSRTIAYLHDHLFGHSAAMANKERPARMPVPLPPPIKPSIMAARAALGAASLTESTLIAAYSNYFSKKPFKGY